MDLIKASLVGHQVSLGLLISSGIGYTFLRKWQQFRREKLEKLERPSRLVVISGCDSGLGLSMASWAATLGYRVIAGCLDSQGEGALFLSNQFPENITIVHLDVTDEQTILLFTKQCKHILQATNTKLWAVISNAAVLVLGEFFWSTRSQRERQMKVNFHGAVNLISSLQPLLFKHQGRLIIVSSDCAEHALPGLAAYAASKAALESWARAVRLEVSKYGVSVVCLQPGDFPKETQMLSGAVANFEEMDASMSAEDREFYGQYYIQWKGMKCKFFGPAAEIRPLESGGLRNDFLFLLEGNIKHISVFKRENPFQKLLHFVMDFWPQFLSDHFVYLIMNYGCYWDQSKKYLPPNNLNGFK